MVSSVGLAMMLLLLLYSERMVLVGCMYMILQIPLNNKHWFENS